MFAKYWSLPERLIKGDEGDLMEGIFNSMATHLLFICSFMSLLTTSSMFVFIFRHMFRFRCLVEL